MTRIDAKPTGLRTTMRRMACTHFISAHRKLTESITATDLTGQQEERKEYLDGNDGDGDDDKETEKK